LIRQLGDNPGLVSASPPFAYLMSEANESAAALLRVKGMGVEIFAFKRWNH
jgi:hypothetical protein